MNSNGPRRRTILLAGATALSAGIAGCNGTSDDGSASDGTTTTSDGSSVDLPVDGEAESLSYGGMAHSTLDESAPRDEEFGGRYEPYVFEGAAGDTVGVGVASRDGATAVYLLDESGGVLADDQAGVAGDNAEIRGFELPEDGGYVALAAAEDSPPLEYSVSLSAGEAADGDLRSIEVGGVATGRIDDADPTARRFGGKYEPVTFEAEAGTSVTIDMTSEEGDPYLFLVGPNLQRFGANDDGGEGYNASIARAELPESGEYTIVAGGYSDATFGYTLSVSEAEPPTDLRSIGVGETAEGELDFSDPRSQDYRGHYEPVTLDAESGQTVRIDMTSEEGDTYLFLEGPDGSVVAENDDGGEGYNSRIDGVTLDADGEYTIVAAGYSNSTFVYELSVSEAEPPADLRSIGVGETVEGEIDGSDPRSRDYRGHYEPVTLDAESGQTVAIDMTSEEGDTYLFLEGPDGSVVAENDDGGEGYNSRIDSVTLESEGEYTIIAGGFSDATFEYELSVAETEPPADLRSIAVGETVEGDIDASDPRSRDYRGHYEPVALDAESGQTVRIDMTSEEGDTYLFLEGPDGSVVAENDDGGEGYDSRIEEFSLESEGEYTIVAGGYSDATFAYELSVESA